MTLKLKAEKRNSDEKKQDLKDNGFIPVVAYSKGEEAESLKVKSTELEKIYSQAGESNLVDLEVAGQDVIKVLFKEIQKDVVKNTIIHADLYKVDMNQPIVTEIPLNFIGEARAVKEHGGMIAKNLDSVEVKCLPANLVNEIDVDLAKLETLTDSVKLVDLDMPEGMELTAEDMQTTVVNILESRSSKADEKEEGAEDTAEGEAKEEGGEEKKEEGGEEK